MSRPSLVAACLFAASSALAAPPAPSPAGFTIDESGCASGGPLIHFFEGGKVIIDGCGDDCPIISEGTWSLSGADISVKLTSQIAGVGDEPVMAASRMIYATYKAVERPTQETASYSWDAEDGCATIRRHDLKTPTTRAILAGAFVRKYPEVSARALTPADLAGKSKAELVEMRNEVFAAYGYVFKNADIARLFEGRPGYSGRFVDVGGLLTPTEKANMELIRGAEKTAQ